MIQTLSAGTAVTLFGLALVLLLAGGDRFAAMAALSGLVALSTAVTAHVSDRRHD